MSSFRNASKSYQKTHRERHQPEARKHLGNLEKQKDYKKRADDYNAKKAQMQDFQKKALDRNPDEFYYHMINSEVKEGIHRDQSKSVELSEEQVKLMQTQDKRYVVARHVMEVRKIERLNERLQRLEEAPVNRHTFFTDDEKNLKLFSLSKRLDTPSALLSRRYNRIRTSDLKNMNLESYVKDPQSVESCNKQRSKSYKELLRRTERRSKLLTLDQKMQVKRLLQNKKRTVKQRIAPETKDAAPIYLFKQERYK